MAIVADVVQQSLFEQSGFRPRQERQFVHNGRSHDLREIAPRERYWMECVSGCMHSSGYRSTTPGAVQPMDRFWMRALPENSWQQEPLHPAELRPPDTPRDR